MYPPRLLSRSNTEHDGELFTSAMVYEGGRRTVDDDTTAIIPGWQNAVFLNQYTQTHDMVLPTCYVLSRGLRRKHDWTPSSTPEPDKTLLSRVFLKDNTCLFTNL